MARDFKVNDLMVRFRFEGNNGNNVFIDNIKISDISQLGLNDAKADNQLYIYPNPANTEVKVAVDKGTLDGKVQLYDVYGKVIHSYRVKQQKQYTVPLNTISEGTYFLKYYPSNVQKSARVQKVIVVK